MHVFLIAKIKMISLDGNIIFQDIKTLRDMETEQEMESKYQGSSEEHIISIEP